MKRALLLLLLVTPLALAGYVGDGICDETDLLRRSPDCAPSVYIDPPRYIVLVPSSAVGTVLTLRYTVKNPYDLPAYVCFIPAPSLDMNRVCFGVPPSSSSLASLSFTLHSSSYIDIVTSYWSRRITLLVVPDWVLWLVSNPSYLSAFGLSVLVLALVFLSRSR